MPRSRTLSRTAWPKLLTALAVVLSVPMVAGQAQAMNLNPHLSPALGATGCGLSGPTSPASPAMQIAAPTSKASAILGGQPSALEAMRLAQEADANGSNEAFAAGDAAVEIALAPAVGGVRPEVMACRFGTIEPQVADSNPENFLASKRLRIGRTSFDQAWRRVSADHVSAGQYRRLLGAVPNDAMTALSSVNRWVNQRIAYADDSALFGRNDYWAGAERTLALGRGDCEDIALTKLELLAAAGISRHDMILTIARDLVRNADHAVLIVRHDGRYYMLDNASDEVFDAATSHDYRPVLSFGDNQTWLHGY
jgi:predicted transglutaminase-like cysteine proteinase